MAKISEQQKKFLTLSILEQSKKAIGDVIKFSDRQKYYEAQFLFRKLSQFVKPTLSLYEITLLSLSLYIMSIKYDEFFHDNTSRYMKHFYSVFDTLVKEAESLLFFYKHLRPEYRSVSNEFFYKLKKIYKEKTGKNYEAYMTFQRTKKENNVILTFWQNHLFSSIEKYKDDPSSPEHLDTIFVSLPKWLDSSYHMVRTDMRKDYNKEFNRLLEEYLNITKPLMPKITDMAHHALETVTMPDPSTVAQEIKSQYAQQIEELKEKAAVNIPKTGNKEEIKRLKQIKKTAKEELNGLQKLQDYKIKSIIRKADNDRNVLEKLYRVSQRYEERVLVKVGRSILKELGRIIWGMSDEHDEMLIQNKAKREVDDFIRRKMKEYHEQSASKA